MSVVAVRSPSPALARFVSSLNYIESDIPTSLERILPGGRIHLMVNLCEDEFRTYDGPDCATVHRTHGAVLEGPHSQPIVIDTKLQRCLVIVNFKLGGALPFFTPPLSEARDQLVELDQLWGRDGGVLRERLLEARTPEAKLQILETVLLDHLVNVRDPDPAIRLAASAFERGDAVSEVAEAWACCRRRLCAVFANMWGLLRRAFRVYAGFNEWSDRLADARRGRLGRLCRAARLCRSGSPDPRLS